MTYQTKGPVCLALLALLCLAPHLHAQEADLILRNARIWTGDTAHPSAQALAVRGERLIAVGTNADVDRHRTTRTRVIDAGGRFVTPGFIDDHTHFNQAGALLIGANLLDVASAAPFASRVKAAVARMSAGAWLTGGDWGAYEDWNAGGTGRDTTRGAARFTPDRSLIDSVSGTTPILLNRWDRSAYLANGVALERAGLSCGTPVPGLECENGRATGRVADIALAHVRSAIATKSFDQRLREARAAQQHLAELGVTTIHDITPPFQLPVYTELKRRGELTVRVFARPTLDKWNELTYAGISPGFGDDWIRIRALKGFVDGIQGNSTARFYEPQLHSGKRGEWRDSTNTAATDGPGSGMEPAGNMERLLFGLDSAGWWANVHAIGDEAIDTVLTIMEKVMRTNGPKERRWRIIHSQVIRNAAVAQRYKRLGIIAEVQPYHAIDDMRWMEERIGARAKWAYAFRTFHDAGVPLLFGSDWPGTNASWYTASPMVILYAALTRQTLDGKPEGGWFPEQRLDLETSLRSYTVNNAWAEGEEANKGSLTVGKLADFVVIDRDLFAIPARQVKDARLLLTVVGGHVVYASSPFRTLDARPPSTAAAFEEEIAAFETGDRRSPPRRGGIVFAGSSSVRMWTDVASAFPALPVLNRGFGGSTLEDVTYFAPRVVLPYRPRLVVLYAGDNDLAAGHTPAEVLADYSAFVRTVRHALPAARIVYVSIKPSPSRWSLVDRMRSANALIARAIARDSLATYVDVFTPMLGANGRPRPELFLADSLHMTAAGYALWRARLTPVVR